MNDSQRVMVTISAAQAERLDRITEETSVSRSAVLSIALSDYLSKWEREHCQTAPQAARVLPQEVRELIAAYVEHLDEEHQRYNAWANNRADTIVDATASLDVEMQG